MSNNDEMFSRNTKHVELIRQAPETTKLSRGPKYLQEPFYELSHQFWPDRDDLKKEAEYIRSVGKHKMVVPVIDEDYGKCVLEFQFSHDETPILNQYLNNFVERYGNFGRMIAHYFYIDEGMNYVWHRDNKPTSTTESFPVQCCVNVIVTDDGSECEFLGHGTYKYTAGVLNTSHLHRVTPVRNRILARISFLDSIYEEVVHRIRKIDRRIT